MVPESRVSCVQARADWGGYQSRFSWANSRGESVSIDQNLHVGESLPNARSNLLGARSPCSPFFKGRDQRCVHVLTPLQETL